MMLSTDGATAPTYYRVRRMLGRTATVLHALPVDSERRAVCGKRPKLHSGWSDLDGVAVTCGACLEKLAAAKRALYVQLPEAVA